MKVAIVIFDGVQALDVAGPLDVFAEANTILPSIRNTRSLSSDSRAGTVACSNGMGLRCLWLCGFDTPMGPAIGRRRPAIARCSAIEESF